MSAFIRALSLTITSLALLTSFGQTNPFESNIRAFEQADLRNPPPTNSILVLGSSTIVGWNSLAAAFPQFSMLNRGFGGSQASDVLFFYDRLVPPYSPPLILFYEGDNDLASGKSVSQVFADWTNFVGLVHRDLPNAHILFLAVKPSPSRVNIINQQRTLNERIRHHTDTDPRLHYADTFTPFLTSAGQTRPELYVGDQLHLNPAGYAVWESVIVPIVEDWAARSPINVMKTERNSVLVDFGSENSLSGDTDSSTVHWNNITTIGSSNTGFLSNLVTSAGLITSASLQMVSRFNGANENGTSSSTNFPSTATRDSLFGNTETFSGQANVTPIFNLVGLDHNTSYRVTFYASRNGVSDNRETTYTASGATTLAVDLNAANNVNNLAIIESIAPDSSGTLNIALSPGPNNNNANHFTYLGILSVESLSLDGPTFLFDFGSSSSPTTTQGPPPGETWNNLTPALGSTDDGKVESLVATNNLLTSIDLEMLSRFNSSNENGTTASTNFLPSATSDSLFGNTESFNGLTNIKPAFKLTGLNPAAIYSLSFFASRTGVADNRETRYTAAGATTNIIDLDAANNTNNIATIPNIRASSNGEIKVELSPGPNNNNANHFTYLGALHLSWTLSQPRDPALIAPAIDNSNSNFNLQLLGNPGNTYTIESSTNLTTWTELDTFPLQSEPQPFTTPAQHPATFYRLKQ